MSRGESKRAHLGCDYVRNIGYIEEILAKILSKLPVDSVQKSKLVSKYWYRLIGESEFAQSHFRCSRENQKYIFYLVSDNSNNGKKLYMMDMSRRAIMPYMTLPNLLEDSSLTCSFNGLLCFTKPVKSCVVNIQICNPATREVLELPNGSPSKKTPKVGIVFELDRNRYKVVRFFCDTFDSEKINYKCEMYTPGDGHWREIAGVVEPPVANPVCVGGRMYWLVWSKQEYEMPEYILSIDMDGNITRIKLPPLVLCESEKRSEKSNGYNGFTFLIQYEGRLGLVAMDDFGCYVHVWSLRNPDEYSWDSDEAGKTTRTGRFEDPINYIDYFNKGIYSVVLIEKELLFMINPLFGDPRLFHFLNLAEKTWRMPKLNSIFRKKLIRLWIKLIAGTCQPMVFPFAESLFRCDAAN